MTRNTSAVAVCCSNASRVSVISRAFSIAMTAWSAKVRTSSICRSVNGSTRCRAKLDRRRSARPRAAAVRRAECGSCPSVVVSRSVYSGSAAMSAIWTARPFKRDPPGQRSAARRAIGVRRRRNSSDSGRQAATSRHSDTPSSSRRMTPPISAPHSRAAVSTSGVQHRLQIEGRAADDLEHLAGRGLVFERLAQRLFGRFTVADIGDRSGQPNRAAGGVAHRHRAVLDPAIGAVAVPDAVFAVQPRRVPRKQSRNASR